MEKLYFGDWFILMQLCKNMHPEIFHDLVRDLRERMDPKLSDNLELRDANPYPTLPLLEKPQAPYMETPWSFPASNLSVMTKHIVSVVYLYLILM